MGLFNKMTFWDALQLLDCDYLSPHLKKKIIKAESNFTEEEKTACYIMYSLHKGDCGLALSFINRAEHGEELIPEIMMALFTHVAVRTFRAAYEKEPSNPDYIAFFAFAYEIGFYDCEKDHAKAVEFADLLRFTDADGALVKYALKKIFPEETHNGSTADDNVRKNATANTDPTSTAVPTSAKDASNKSEPQGEFKRIEIDGDLFEGYFLNGKKNGRGKYIWANGNVYDGNWVDGKCTGKGRISWSSGASFDGEWKDNQMSEGKYSFADGSVYEGSFKNGKYDGYGKRIYKDGDKYEGWWQSGSRNGKGVYTWADGDVYDGEWKDDKRCGVGRMVKYGKTGPDALNAGEIFIKYSYDGEWLDNREHGHGICREGNGTVAGMDKVYEGEWVNGKKCGRFVWHFLHRDGETGKSYIDFYEDGNLIETCIPYDERIKTVEDIRRAKGKPSVASENLHHMNISNIPSCDRVKSGEYSDKVKKETEARRQYIRETVRRLRNPEENASPYYRNIENACMTLAPFMTEAENLFLKGEEEKALEIIEEMLDINIVPDDEWYYNSEIKYFSQFLSGALYSLASQIDFDTPDHDRFIVPAANIACYLWKKYGDYSLFGSVAFLWSETEKDQCGNFLWLKRMSDNGDYTVVSKYNESSEYYFGHDLDRYTMGSDCELF